MFSSENSDIIISKVRNKVKFQLVIFLINKRQNKMNSNSNKDSFQKSQKKNRQFDDGLNKQSNSNKFKEEKYHSKQTNNY